MVLQEDRKREEMVVTRYVNNWSDFKNDPSMGLIFWPQ